MQTNYNRDKIHGKTDRSTNDRNDTRDLEENKKKKKRKEKIRKVKIRNDDRKME